MNALKFARCLRELGITNLEFNNRKKLCNLAYLLTMFGVDLGLPLSSFKWYLHGIYNAEVTELIHTLKKQNIARSVERRKG